MGFNSGFKGLIRLSYSLHTRRGMCVQRSIEWRSRNHCWRGTAISITYSECVSTVLVTQHAKRLRPIILSSAACPALPIFFSTLFHKLHDFREINYLIQNVCFDFLFRFLSENIFHSKNNSVRYWHRCKQAFMYT